MESPLRASPSVDRAVPAGSDTTPDISTRVVSVFLHHFEQVHGPEHTARAMARIGGPARNYVLDPENFVSLEYCARLAEVLTEEAGDPDFLTKAGLRQQSQPWLLGFVYYLLRSLGSPALYYRAAARSSASFNRVGDMTVERLSERHVRFRYRSKKPEGTALLCRGRIGQLASAPILFGLPPARASEIQCQLRGADACVYELEWAPMVRPAVRSLAGAVAGGGVAVVLTRVLGAPALAGFVPLLLSIGAALLGAMAGLVSAHRARSARAQRQVLDAAEAATQSMAELRQRFQEVQRLHAQAEADRVALAEQMERRQQAESALVDAQKLEAVGRLSGGIAHDFNNLLTIILNYAELGKARSTRPDQVVTSMDAIAHAATRAADLTRKLLAFARRQVVEPRVIVLEEQLRALEGLIGRLVGEDVRVELELGEPASNLSIDPGQLEQVILNLAANARDAMPKGGVLRLTTRRLGADEPGVAGGPSGERVELAVRDTGHGMDTATQQRVFEPFFTTKEPGRGTGLGLASCYGIVSQADGVITLESDPGRGTVFRVVLPRVSDQPSEQRVRSSVAARGSGETLLVVEDDAGLRAMMAEALGSAGYLVRAAAGTTDALAIVEQARGSLALLITDVVLRGVDGYELSKAARVLVPALPVLFVSGYPNEVIERHGIPPGELRLLKKPFTFADLTREVRSALDQAPSAGRDLGHGRSPVGLAG